MKAEHEVRPNGEALAAAWLARARRVARKVNLGWWLDAVSRPLLAAAVVGACVLLLLRRARPDFPPAALAAACGAIVVGLMLFAWWRAARHFESAEQAMVRLEGELGLRGALSAARAGVAAWPEPMMDRDSAQPLRWRWRRLLPPLLGALLLLAAGLFVPIPAPAASGRLDFDQPQAWGALESEIERLAEQAAADESYLEELRQRLAELKEQPPEQWFSHASLEATDSLRDSHRSEAHRLNDALERAERALEQLAEPGAEPDPAAMLRLLEEFDQALEDLQGGEMKPNPDLLDALRGIDPRQLNRLDPEQLQALRDQLGENLRALQDAAEGLQGPGDAGDEPGGGGEPGDQPGPGGDAPGQDPGPDGDGNDGRGGIGEGGEGPPPPLFGRERDPLAGRIEVPPSNDPSRAAMGDLLEIEDSPHPLDLSPGRPSEGGAAAASGSGGDRVWRERLDPDEQRALKRFFE